MSDGVGYYKGVIGTKVRYREESVANTVRGFREGESISDLPAFLCQPFLFTYPTTAEDDGEAVAISAVRGELILR